MRKTKLCLPNIILGSNFYVPYQFLYGDSHFVYAKVLLLFAPFSPFMPKNFLRLNCKGNTKFMLSEIILTYGRTLLTLLISRHGKGHTINMEYCGLFIKPPSTNDLPRD